MPKYFKVIEDGVVKTMPFNRFHVAEVTGSRVRTIQEMPGEAFELSNEQAQELIDKWNSDYPYPAGNTTYSL